MHSANDRFPRPLQDASGPAGAASSSLTYEPFYGLREKPFSLSADPRFLFRSPAHGAAFDELQAGIRRREGLIVLTGEIGTGKTTLCRSVLDHLDRRTFAAFVADPFVSREDLLKTLLVDFGVVSVGDLTRGRFSGASRSDLSYPLYEFLDSLVPLQAFAVVVIDEAQKLSLPVLEEIRILAELERREKLLQVVLVGHPELRSSLRLPEMRQVDQRVSVRCELTALDAAGVAGYVSHRLMVAGRGQGRVEFTTPALEAIHAGSSGIPRLINRICDRALQRAYVSRAMQIGVEFVSIAVDDLGLSASVVLPETPAREEPSNESCPPWLIEMDAQAAAAMPAPAIGLEADAGLDAFTSESRVSQSDHSLMRRLRTHHGWLAGAAATFLAVSASVGAATWYSSGQSATGVHEVAALTPPNPAQQPPQPADLRASVEPAVSQSPALAPVQPASVVRADATRPRLGAGTAAPGLSPARSAYSIVVASFTGRERAQRLVDELTSAGYGARAVERDGGPGRGRFVQVQVGGYTSAADVQRDLQRIRELPGGYGDATIVERR